MKMTLREALRLLNLASVASRCVAKQATPINNINHPEPNRDALARTGVLSSIATQIETKITSSNPTHPLNLDQSIDFGELSAFWENISDTEKKLCVSDKKNTSELELISETIKNTAKLKGPFEQDSKRLNKLFHQCQEFMETEDHFIHVISNIKKQSEALNTIYKNSSMLKTRTRKEQKEKALEVLKNFNPIDQRFTLKDYIGIAKNPLHGQDVLTRYITDKEMSTFIQNTLIPTIIDFEKHLLPFLTLLHKKGDLNQTDKNLKSEIESVTAAPFQRILRHNMLATEITTTLTSIMESMGLSTLQKVTQRLENTSAEEQVQTLADNFSKVATTLNTVMKPQQEQACLNALFTQLKQYSYAHEQHAMLASLSRFFSGHWNSHYAAYVFKALDSEDLLNKTNYNATDLNTFITRFNTILPEKLHERFKNNRDGAFYNILKQAEQPNLFKIIENIQCIEQEPSIPNPK